MAKIGTNEWWLTERVHGRGGIIHAIANLVASHDITPMKAVEMIQQLFYARKVGIPNAPWDEATVTE